MGAEKIPIKDFIENPAKIRKEIYRYKNHILRNIKKLYPKNYGFSVLDQGFYGNDGFVYFHFHVYLHIPEIQDNPERQKIFFRKFKDKRGNRILLNPLTKLLQKAHQHFKKKGLNFSYYVTPSPKSVKEGLRYAAIRDAGLFDYQEAYTKDVKGNKIYKVSLKVKAGKKTKRYKPLEQVIKQGRYKTIPDVFNPHTAFKLFYKKRTFSGINVKLPSLAIILKDILTDKLTEKIKELHPKLQHDDLIIFFRPCAKMLKDPPRNFFRILNLYLKTHSVSLAEFYTLYDAMVSELENKAKQKLVERTVNPFGFYARTFRETAEWVNFLSADGNYYTIQDLAEHLNLSVTETLDFLRFANNLNLITFKSQEVQDFNQNEPDKFFKFTDNENSDDLREMNKNINFYFPKLLPDFSNPQLHNFTPEIQTVKISHS